MTIPQSLVECHTVILQRSFTISGGITDAIILAIVKELSSEQATGKVTINLSQGSVGSIQFEESAKI
jgi:hypothetical protein